MKSFGAGLEIEDQTTQIGTYANGNGAYQTQTPSFHTIQHTNRFKPVTFSKGRRSASSLSSNSSSLVNFDLDEQHSNAPTPSLLKSYRPRSEENDHYHHVPVKHESFHSIKKPAQEENNNIIEGHSNKYKLNEAHNPLPLINLRSSSSLIERSQMKRGKVPTSDSNNQYEMDSQLESESESRLLLFDQKSFNRPLSAPSRSSSEDSHNANINSSENQYFNYNSHKNRHSMENNDNSNENITFVNGSNNRLSHSPLNLNWKQSPNTHNHNNNNNTPPSALSSENQNLLNSKPKKFKLLRRHTSSLFTLPHIHNNNNYNHNIDTDSPNHEQNHHKDNIKDGISLNDGLLEKEIKKIKNKKKNTKSQYFLFEKTQEKSSEKSKKNSQDDQILFSPSFKYLKQNTPSLNQRESNIHINPSSCKVNSNNLIILGVQSKVISEVQILIKKNELSSIISQEIINLNNAYQQKFLENDTLTNDDTFIMDVSPPLKRAQSEESIPNDDNKSDSSPNFDRPLSENMINSKIRRNAIMNHSDLQTFQSEYEDKSNTLDTKQREPDLELSDNHLVNQYLKTEKGLLLSTIDSLLFFIQNQDNLNKSNILRLQHDAKTSEDNKITKLTNKYTSYIDNQRERYNENIINLRKALSETNYKYDNIKSIDTNLRNEIVQLTDLFHHEQQLKLVGQETIDRLKSEIEELKEKLTIALNKQLEQNNELTNAYYKLEHEKNTLLTQYQELISANQIINQKLNEVYLPSSDKTNDVSTQTDSGFSIHLESELDNPKLIVTQSQANETNIPLAISLDKVDASIINDNESKSNRAVAIYDDDEDFATFKLSPLSFNTDTFSAPQSNKANGPAHGSDADQNNQSFTSKSVFTFNQDSNNNDNNLENTEVIKKNGVNNNLIENDKSIQNVYDTITNITTIVNNMHILNEISNQEANSMINKNNSTGIISGNSSNPPGSGSGSGSGSGVSLGSNPRIIRRPHFHQRSNASGAILPPVNNIVSTNNNNSTSVSPALEDNKNSLKNPKNEADRITLSPVRVLKKYNQMEDNFNDMGDPNQDTISLAATSETNPLISNGPDNQINPIGIDMGVPSVQYNKYPNDENDRKNFGMMVQRLQRIRQTRIESERYIN